MKRAIIIVALGLTYALSFGQEVQKSFNIGSTKKVSVTADYPSVTIHQGSGSEMKVTGTFLFNGIPANDAVTFSWNSSTGTLNIESDIKKWEKLSEEERAKQIDKLDCEEIKEMWKKQKSNKYGGWNFEAEVAIWLPSTVSSLEVKSTYGGITIEKAPKNTDVFNTYGPIEASAANSFDSYKLISTYSSVTLNMPGSGKTDISLQSNYGEIYTDLDFDINSEESTNKAYKTIIVGSLNNGGNSHIELCSDYSNVYLKKS
ncbi:MAG: DUF4097 family beta strand repeat-containing protein [Bacteroidota bacterium]